MIITQPGQQLEHVGRFYQQTLLLDVIPFWFPRSVDQEFGGYLHCLDSDGSIVDTDKSVWAQGRMSWMLLTLYNTFEPRIEWLKWGQVGLDFLMRHGFDSDGRMYFHLTQDGRPIRKRRYAFSESFAAIACGSLYRATGDGHWKQRANELFEFFIKWNFTPGLMPAKFFDTRPMSSIGPRMIAIAIAQSLREDVGPNDLYDQWIDRCISDIATRFVKHDIRAVMENVAEDGTIVDHFDGRLLNPGHAIEVAWFIMQEGNLRSDDSLVSLGCKILEYSWNRGWDTQYGGLFYFRDVKERPIQEYWHDMKFWWPHNEAIIATLMAFQLTKNPLYAKWHQEVHNWSFQHFSDARNGEWFGYLHRDGRISSTLKGNLWKSFFHYPRMLWKCCQLLIK